jgi:(2Fe-2S) ferredoxin
MNANSVNGDRPQNSEAEGDFSLMHRQKLRVLICQHKTCLKDGAAPILQAGQAQQTETLEVLASGCLGNCGSGPTVLVLPDQKLYSYVRSREFATIVNRHLGKETALPPPKLEQSPKRQASSATRSRLVAIIVISLAGLLIVTSAASSLHL